MSPLRVRCPGRAAAALLVLLALVLAACEGSDGGVDPDVPDGGPSAGTPSLAVALQGIPGVTVADATPAAAAVVRCTPSIRLSVGGSGRAVMRALVVERYRGATRVVADARVERDSAQLAAMVVATTLSAGEGMVLALPVIEDAAPFTARVGVAWSRAAAPAATDTAWVRAECGPALVASASPPAIADVAVVPPSDGVDAGDTLAVRFRIDTPQGLWRTTVRLSGPCAAGVEATARFETTGMREVRVPLPATCTGDGTFAASVTATDAALREATLDAATTLRLTDRSAPELAWRVPSLLEGTPVFAGDTLYPPLQGSDDRGLRWLIVGAEGRPERDTVVLGGATSLQAIRLPVRTWWVGASRLLARLVDTEGKSSAELASAAGEFTFLPSRDVAARGTTFADEIIQVEVDRRGNPVVLQRNPTRLTVLARETLTPLASFDLGTAPVLRVELTPSGDSAIVLRFGVRELAIVDLTPAVPVLRPAFPLAALDAAPDEAPTMLVATARGTLLMTARTGGNAYRVVEVSLATGALTPRPELQAGLALASGGMLFRSGDGRIVMHTTTPEAPCTRRWTTTSDAFDACRPVYLWHYGMPSLDASGGTVLVGGRVYDGALGNARELAYLGYPGRLDFRASRLGADGSMAYVAWDTGPVRARTADGALVELLRPTGGAFGRRSDYGALAISPDGRTLVLFTPSAYRPGRLVLMSLP